MKKSLVFLLALLTMVGPLAIDTYLPSFPAIGRTFSVPPELVQQTLSVFLFTFASMMLFHGVLSDAFGRRRVILVSLVVYAASSVLAAFAPSFTWLLVARALQGSAAGAGSVVGQAIVMDKVEGAAAQKHLSQIMMVFALAPAIAPVVGGWMQVTLGWRAIFILLAAVGALLWLISCVMLPETLPANARRRPGVGELLGAYGHALSRPAFLAPILAIGMAFGGLALYFGSASHFVMGILGLSETAFAWMFLPLIGGLLMGSAAGGALSAKLAPNVLVRVGYGVMGAGAVLNVGYNVLFEAEVPWAVLPLFVYTFGMAMANPGLMVQAFSVLPDKKGLASSLQSFVQMMLFAVICGAGAPLVYQTGLSLAWGLVACLVLSIACWAWAQRAARQPAQDAAHVPTVPAIDAMPQESRV